MSPVQSIVQVNKTSTYRSPLFQRLFPECAPEVSVQVHSLLLGFPHIDQEVVLHTPFHETPHCRHPWTWNVKQWLQSRLRTSAEYSWWCFIWSLQRRGWRGRRPGQFSGGHPRCRWPCYIHSLRLSRTAAGSWGCTGAKLPVDGPILSCFSLRSTGWMVLKAGGKPKNMILTVLPVFSRWERA